MDGLCVFSASFSSLHFQSPGGHADTERVVCWFYLSGLLLFGVENNYKPIADVDLLSIGLVYLQLAERHHIVSFDLQNGIRLGSQTPEKMAQRLCF